MPNDLFAVVLALHRARARRRALASRLALAALAALLFASLDALCAPICRGDRIGDARHTTRSLVQSVEQFRLSHRDRCPRDLAELIAAGLLRRPPIDPWGRAYTLGCTRAHIVVCSPGRHLDDPTDDICDESPSLPRCHPAARVPCHGDRPAAPPHRDRNDKPLARDLLNTTRCTTTCEPPSNDAAPGRSTSSPSS